MAEREFEGIARGRVWNRTDHGTVCVRSVGAADGGSVPWAYELVVLLIAHALEESDVVPHGRAPQHHGGVAFEPRELRALHRRAFERHSKILIAHRRTHVLAPRIVVVSFHSMIALVEKRGAGRAAPVGGNLFRWRAP